MSKRTEEIIRKLKDLGRINTYVNAPAKVISVDESKQICKVDIDGIEIDEIRLNAVIDDDNATFSYLVPVVGSWVIVSFIEGSETDGYISSFSDVDKLILNANEIVFNKGELKGLPKSESLIQKLNAIEQDINSLKQAINGWIAVAQDGGAALKAALTSWFGAQLTESKLVDIENTKIKQ